MIELYPWQKKAYKKWRLSGRRGTIDSPTGSGKSHIGLKVIEKYADSKSILIVVPYISLLDQWYEKIRDLLGIKIDRIGRIGGSHHDFSCRISVAVVNSVRNLPEIKRDILILDEIHHMSSKENFKFIKRGLYGWVLGFSATPENEGEDRNRVIEYYAPIVYKYKIKDAVDDGVLSKHSVIFVESKLTSDERARYNEVQKYINMRRPPVIKSFASLPPNLKKAYQERKNIANNAENKIKITDAIIRQNKDQKIIVFCEHIKMADAISNEVEEKHAIYHSEVKAREDHLLRFKCNNVRLLISCKALDEGMDCPSASIGIVASGTKVSRQSVQRIGRILRKQEGKHAILYVLYSLGTTEEHDAKNKAAIYKDGASNIKWVKQSEILNGD